MGSIAKAYSTTTPTGSQRASTPVSSPRSACGMMRGAAARSGRNMTQGDWAPIARPHQIRRYGSHSDRWQDKPDRCRTGGICVVAGQHWRLAVRADGGWPMPGQRPPTQDPLEPGTVPDHGHEGRTARRPRTGKRLPQAAGCGPCRWSRSPRVPARSERMKTHVIGGGAGRCISEPPPGPASGLGGGLLPAGMIRVRWGPAASR
jgi:hypothetical protein